MSFVSVYDTMHLFFIIVLYFFVDNIYVSIDMFFIQHTTFLWIYGMFK